MKLQLYRDFSKFFTTQENNSVYNTYITIYLYIDICYNMAKKAQKKEETETKQTIMKEIRNEGSTMDPNLIEMAHKLEDNV